MSMLEQLELSYITDENINVTTTSKISLAFL